MAVNLIDRFGRERSREILESSFAQFQADRAVVGLARQVKEAEESLAGYATAMACDRGDFAEYAGIRRDLSDLEKLHRKDATASRATRDARVREIQSLRRRMQRHPCHSCPDRELHARWGERYAKLQRQSDTLRRQIDARTGTVARIFDRVVDVLTALDYVRADAGTTTLTDAGRTMRRIYGERDLLVAESLRRGSGSDSMHPRSRPSSARSSTSRDATSGDRGSGGFPAVPSARRSTRPRRSGRSSTIWSAITASQARSRPRRGSLSPCTNGPAGCLSSGC